MSQMKRHMENRTAQRIAHRHGQGSRLQRFGCDCTKCRYGSNTRAPRPF